MESDALHDDGIHARRLSLLVTVGNLPEEAWGYFVVWAFNCRLLASGGGFQPAAEMALREVAAAAVVYMKEQT